MIKQKTASGFERIIYFEKGWNRRGPNPSKDFGVGSLGIRFLLKGKKGAIQFHLDTGWYPHLIGYYQDYIPVGGNLSMILPRPTDLGYHAYEPQYEGQKSITDKCPFLDDKPCYYDGSSLQAAPLFKILVEQGDEALWNYLECEYINTFGED